METFLLVAWIYVGGGQFEQVRTPGLSAGDCLALAEEVERTQTGARASCWGKLRPHICGFGDCTPTVGPGNSLLATPLRP